ncbi:MAG: lytic transglycosylase domain-containing protein [Deltaproteobacteria bacterium]
MITLKHRRIALLMIIFTVILIGIVLFISNNRIVLKMIYPLKFQEEVDKYSNEFDIDPFLVFAVMKAESNFDKYAVSGKGAKGLMQITDKTGVWAAEKIGIKDFSSSNLFIPDVNIHIGCWYLSKLKKQFDGNITLAITAYNGGSGRVQEWLRNEKLSSTGKSLEKIPFIETDKYVRKVLREYEIIKYIYGK